MQISWDPLQFDLTLDQYPVVQVSPGATGIASSLETYNPSFPSAPVRSLTMVPVQMHWHVVSEHSVDGKYVRPRCSAPQQRHGAPYARRQLARANTSLCRRSTCGELVPPEWAGHLAGAGFALRCWLCSASADVMMGHVYVVRLVAVLVVR